MKKKIEYNYFSEFIQMSINILESSKLLTSVLKNYNTNELKENIKKIHEFENNNDHIVHAMKSYLFKDFLPPIDREDISMIVDKLDDIEDCIDEISINLDILNITSIRETGIEFCEVVEVATNLLVETMELFKDLKKKESIKEQIIKINAIEEQGDRLFEKSISKLYKEETDPIEIIKWTSLFNDFENTLDSCEHLANSLEDVMMKI